jgi:hypothetical protein
MNEITKVPPEAGTDMEYLPSTSVAVPLVVPFNTTFTPGSGEPSSTDVTLPETVLSCAHISLLAKVNTAVKHNSRILFIRKI